MAVGEDVVDPDARAIIELVQTFAPAALRAAEHWEQRVDWSAGDLAIEVRSWTPRVNVVSRALTAVDEHWRIATAILDAEIPADATGLQLRDLIDAGGTAGDVVIHAAEVVLNHVAGDSESGAITAERRLPRTSRCFSKRPTKRPPRLFTV